VGRSSFVCEEKFTGRTEKKDTSQGGVKETKWDFGYMVHCHGKKKTNGAGTLEEKNRKKRLGWG